MAAGYGDGELRGTFFSTAMTHLTGDFGQAVRLSSEVLAVLGRIYPSTAANVALEATLSKMEARYRRRDAHQPEPATDHGND